MAITKYNNYLAMGQAADTKPTAMAVDSLYIERDTGKFFRKTDATTWTQLFSLTGGASKQIPDYIVYKNGSTTEALNTSTGVVDYTHATDGASVLNSVITAVNSAGGGCIAIKGIVLCL